MRGLHAALALLVATGLCPADDPPEPGLRFHASFNRRDVTADFALGDPRSTTFTDSLELRSVPGVSGPGFQIAPDERLDYDLPGNFSPAQGTVSMWVKPVNWEGNNGRFEMFFHVSAPGYTMHLYKYTQPNHLFTYMNVGGQKVIVRTTIEDWRQDEWHAIATSWGSEVIRLYLDGEKVHELDLPEDMELPEVEEGFFTITPPKLWEQGFDPDDRTIADEVKIYDRMLADAEIRRDYLRLAPEQADAEPLAMRYETDSAADAVLVELDTFRLMGDGGNELTVSATLADGTGAVLADAEAQTQRGAASLKLPFGELAPGQYSLTARAMDAGGEVMAETSASFERPEMTWDDAPRYEHAVPEPWTHVEGDERRAAVWGREYRFGDGPLPREIDSQQGAILSGPVRLEVDGTEPAWGAATVTEQEPNVVRRAGEGQAEEITVAWQSAVEFDGMLRCDLTLRPMGERAEVRGLRLVVPVAAGHAGYVLTPLLTPWGEDGRIALDFKDIVWLTGHYTGLCWFAESRANWVRGEAPPITVERGDTATTLTIELIGSPVTIDGPVSYTFGLQATPVRPLPERWRGLNFASHQGVEGRRTLIVAQGGGCFYRDAWLEPRSREEMEAALGRWRGWGRALPYSTPTYLADRNPIFDFYQLEWRNSERHSFVGYKTADGLEYAIRATCPRSDFSELMVSWVERLFDEYEGIGGIYYDCCSASPCRNEKHGCGGRDIFGRAYRTSPIFDLRDVLRRVYTIVHEHGGIIVNHQHSYFYPPIHAFSDYWFPGEQYTGRLGQDIWFYTDGLPPEVWQIELSSRIRGVGVQFLPEYGRGTDLRYRDEETAPSRSLIACCAVHDVPVSGHWIHVAEVAEIWAIYDRFDLSSATFRGYWEDDCPVAVDEPLLASAYVGEGAVVVVVSNLTPEAARGTVRVDAETLGVGEGWTVAAQPGGETIEAPPSAIPVEVPGRDYRVIALVR